MLYKRFAPVVHGVLLSRVGRADADDLTQDVFVRAMTRLSDVRDGAAVGGWLIAIARNAAATLTRRPRLAPLGEHELAIPRVDSEEGESEEAKRVLAVIRGLPEAYRETLVLRLVEGLTGPEIAARMGMTHGSVRVNLCRGMQMLKERVGECGAGGNQP
jgi:RNA polymerase sigma-70 factor (ECF subfamily)